jgi:Electron transfer DM13
MKLLSFSLAVLFLFASCKKKTSDEVLNEQINPNATLLVQGSFTSTPGHSVNGNAEIVNDNNQKRLVLKNFSSTAGPDLKVYLATTLQATTIISLGNLKSTNGMQVYDVSGMPDFTQYKYVLIWCQQFSVLFGSAELR